MSGRQRTRRWWWLLALAAALPLLSEVAHPVLSAASSAFAHHFVHIASVIAAGVIFWSLVAQDISRNGVPPRLRWVTRLAVRGRAGA